MDSTPAAWSEALRVLRPVIFLVMLLAALVPSGVDLVWADEPAPPAAPGSTTLFSKVLSGDLSGSGDYPNTVTVGFRTWLSQGKYAYNFRGGGGHPNVISELQWQGQNIPIYELTAELVYRRLVFNLSGGYGAIGKGTMRDLDWDNDGRQCGGPGADPDLACSDTLSTPTKGFVWFVNADVGPRLLRWKWADQVGALDLLAGFQYWQERYTAFGATDLTTGQEEVPPSVAGVTETIRWASLRLGPRLVLPVFSRLQLVGSAFYIPYSYYRMDDVHHLRTELRHDPSSTDISTGATGIQLEGAARVRLWKGLLFEAGYRYWDMRATGGTTTNFLANGQVLVQDLNKANSRRQGVTLSLMWAF